MANELRFNLDTSTINYVGKRCKQGDDRTLILTLLSQGVAFPVTGAILSLKAQRPNNTYIIQDTNLNIVNNIITIPMDSRITDVAGQVNLELKITLAEKDISTFTFFVEVEPSVITDGSLASGNVITSLDELDGKISLMNLLESELERNIDNAQGASYYLEGVVDNAHIGNEALNYSIIDAEDKNHALQVSTIQANTANDALTEDINIANLVKGYLADEVTSATNIDITLRDTITTANTSNVSLQGESDYALAVKDDLTQINDVANFTKTNLQTLVNEANSIVMTPIGSITMWAGEATPEGWLKCEGQFVSKIAYQELFNAIGSRYGTSNSTIFTLPDLRGRIPVGVNNVQTEFDTLGETGGTKTNTLLNDNLPTHTHEATATSLLTASGSGDFTIKATSTLGNTNIPTDDSYLAQVNKVGATFVNPYNDNVEVIKDINMAGGTVNVFGDVEGQIFVTNEFAGNPSPVPVNNIQPYIVLNYIIRAI